MEERRRTQRRRKDRDSIVGGPRIIASDHPAVNGLSDTHEGRGHACKGIRMQGRVSPCTRTNAWVNGWPWVGESLRRGQKRRERNPFWRLPLTTLSLSLSLCLSARSCATLSPSLCLLCSSARVRSYGLTLAGRSSVCQFKVVAFITVGGI